MAGGEGATISGSAMLAALLLCGLMGLLGQGVRAAVGLKNAASGPPDQQSVFSAAYFLISLMIGFIAGVLAGMGIGPEQFVTFDTGSTKLLLGLAAAGYAGADFIENSFAKLVPDLAAASGPARALQGTPGQTPREAAAHAIPTAPVTGGAAASEPLQGLGPALTIVAPRVRQDVWLPPLRAAFGKYDLLTNRRAAAAIGQFLVEAGTSFQELAENMNYTHAERIAEVFPHAFATVDAARPYVGKPEALANKVYADRLGNGDESSGDGFRFRGRGLIQLTGRSEYREFAATLGKTAEEAAAYCETPEGAAMSGCWYLASRGCLVLADNWRLTEITRKVNGEALLGNAQRIAYSDALLKALGG